MQSAAVTYPTNVIVAAAGAGAATFAAFETLAAVVLQGNDEVFRPLRMIGATVLGRGALYGSYSDIAVLIGVVVHVAFSLAFTFIFAALVSPAWSRVELLAAGIGFGVVLWITNFFVIAPVAGWWWFADQTNPIVQVIAHAFFFGAPIAWMLSRSPSDLTFDFDERA